MVICNAVNILCCFLNKSIIQAAATCRKCNLCKYRHTNIFFDSRKCAAKVGKYSYCLSFRDLLTTLPGMANARVESTLAAFFAQLTMVGVGAPVRGADGLAQDRTARRALALRAHVGAHHATGAPAAERLLAWFYGRKKK